MLVFKHTGGGGGDFESIPILKYSATSGRTQLEDRILGANGWETKLTQIPDGKLSAVFDLENVEWGWMLFAQKTAPDFRLFPLDVAIGAPPSAAHKEGFRIMLKMSKEYGGDVRELCSTAACVKAGFADLYNNAYKKAGKPAGTLPVVGIPQTTQVTTGSGAKKSTNYQPVFAIVDWVARPADLVFKPKSATTHAPIPGPASTGATKVGPPVAAQQAASSDFG